MPTSFFDNKMLCMYYSLFGIFLLAASAKQFSLDRHQNLSRNADYEYYLSIVMVGRNDDKRGDYVGRLQNSLDFFIDQSESFSVSTEIIIVEWNPFQGMARLHHLLRRHPSSRVPVRIITVPTQFHLSVQGNTGQDFFEFMAKNVGARRARGRWLLLTNGDIMLSDAVWALLGREGLDEGAFYRIARIDLPGVLDPLAPLDRRRAVAAALLELEGDERTCAAGTAECPGEYNRGECEGGGAGGDEGTRDEAYLPAAGDFMLMTWRDMDLVGGYHQVQPPCPRATQPVCARMRACVRAHVCVCVYRTIFLCLCLRVCERVMCV